MSIYSNIGKELIEQANNNLEEAAKELLNDANLIVPVDTGHLKSTGKVVTGDGEVSVVYDADYAIYVHEIPGHSYGYKWLERTIDQNIDRYIDIIGGDKK